MALQPRDTVMGTNPRPMLLRGEHRNATDCACTPIFHHGISSDRPPQNEDSPPVASTTTRVEEEASASTGMGRRLFASYTGGRPSSQEDLDAYCYGAQRQSSPWGSGTRSTPVDNPVAAMHFGSHASAHGTEFSPRRSGRSIAISHPGDCSPSLVRGARARVRSSTPPLTPLPLHERGSRSSSTGIARLLSWTRSSTRRLSRTNKVRPVSARAMSGKYPSTDLETALQQLGLQDERGAPTSRSMPGPGMPRAPRSAQQQQQRKCSSMQRPRESELGLPAAAAAAAAAAGAHAPPPVHALQAEASLGDVQLCSRTDGVADLHATLPRDWLLASGGAAATCSGDGGSTGGGCVGIATTERRRASGPFAPLMALLSAGRGKAQGKGGDTPHEPLEPFPQW
jgi:hypothetical protein